MRKNVLPRAFLGIAVLLAIPFLSICEEDDIYSRKREMMVRIQLQGRDIKDLRVLDAMGTIPRHLFVRPSLRSQAYSDNALEIDEGQTISQPYIVAIMTQSLDLQKGQKVLEIGTGSGYQAAVLAHITDQVYSIEIRKNLAKKAEATLKMLNYDQVRVKWSDGYFGWEENAPFDAIIVTCAANHIPPPLIKQLKEGGKLIIPLGSTLLFQSLTLVTKTEGKPKTKQLLDVRFVPMVGEVRKEKRE